MYPVAGSSNCPDQTRSRPYGKTEGYHNFHWQLGFKARNTDLNDCSCMNQVAARRTDKHSMYQKFKTKEFASPLIDYLLP
jgi:hypothetical protein